MERKTKSSRGDSSANKQRVDRWIKHRFPGLTARHIAEACQKRLVVTGEGRPLAKGDYLRQNLLSFERLETHLATLRQGNGSVNLPILYEDDAIVVVDKAAGLPSQPISLFDSTTVSHWALAKYPEVGAEFPEVQPVLTPHRLDIETSGVQVVAKRRGAFELWRQAFGRKEVVKKYWAWCWGQPERQTFEIDVSLAHHPSDTRRMVVATTDRYRAPVMRAESSISVLERLSERGIFLAEVFCRTGATHQVRVHMASCGYPLVGDPLYDAQFLERSLKPAGHLLRAMELEWKEFKFRALADPFYSSFMRTVSS